MYEKLPLRQSLVKIGGWLAMAAPNWTVSHDPVTKGGGMMCDGHPESPEWQTFTIFTARETSCSVHTHTTLCRNWRMSPVKLGVKTQKYLAQR